MNSETPRDNSFEELLSEIKDPNTPLERLVEINDILEQEVETQTEMTKEDWIDKTNEELAGMLLDPRVSHEAKDEISQWVQLQHRLKRSSAPAED